MSARSRPLIMGILNVTDDSFSDGGDFFETGAAVKHALEMIREGADIIDVGGESTRPGAARLPADVQLARVLPVIRGIRKLAGEAPISIDTTLAEVAEAAIDAGATMINDVSAGRDDDRMFGLASRKAVELVLMHMQGTPATMQRAPVYSDVVSEVLEFLKARAAEAESAGVPAGNLLIDPGIGFGKTLAHNLELLRHLDRFTGAGYRTVLGTSRKRFLRTICGMEDPSALAGASAATTALGVLAGVQVFRVHDVRENRQAADVAFRLAAAVPDCQGEA